MFGDLPAEVLQQIIEPHVVGDSQSLKSCSLVCWQWRYVTLPFLMFKVIVTYGRIGTPKGRKVTVQDIRDSIPFLSQYLRHLVISTSSYILRSEDAEEANDVLHALLAAIPQLTLLSKLSLTNDGLFNLLASTQGPLSNISHFTVYQPVEILPIKTIKAFTHLRVLHLVGVSFDCHGTTVGCSRDPHEAKFPVPVLEELALRLSPISFVIFVQWACRTDTLDFSQLKTLKMAMEDGQAETYCFLDELVPLVGASIQTLDLDLYNLASGPMILINGLPGRARDSEPARSFPSLTTLRLRLRPHCQDKHIRRKHWQWVPRCLADFTSNKPLRVVEVLLWDLAILVNPLDLEDLELAAQLSHWWAEADSSLSGGGGLQRFMFHPPRDEINIPNDWSPTLLHSLLPILSSKGVLQVKQSDDIWPGFGGGEDSGRFLERNFISQI